MEVQGPRALTLTLTLALALALTLTLILTLTLTPRAQTPLLRSMLQRRELGPLSLVVQPDRLPARSFGLHCLRLLFFLLLLLPAADHESVSADRASESAEVRRGRWRGVRWHAGRGRPH